MGKEQEPEPYYVEKHSAVDSILSSDTELAKSLEYGSEDARGYVYSEVSLRSIYKYWVGEQNNPIRSPRSREVGKVIAERALFEIAYRKGEVKKLERLYGDTN